jgi:hypothetical protein
MERRLLNKLKAQSFKAAWMFRNLVISLSLKDSLLAFVNKNITFN